MDGVWAEVLVPYFSSFFRPILALFIFIFLCFVARFGWLTSQYSWKFNASPGRV
jgi:hypothetical protein